MSEFIKIICTICGKEVEDIILKDYVYKYKGKVFCSWHCLRQYEKSLPEYKIFKDRLDRISK